MANDPNQRGGWPPGQQPTSYDPMTGQPIYASAPPQPTSFDPMTGQPIYASAPPPQPQSPPPQPAPPPHAQQGWQSTPNPYAAPAQQQANPYAAPPQNPYAAPPQNPYAAPPMSSAWGAGAGDASGLRAQADATVGVSDRVRFIRMTYIHLFGAIAAFALLLVALFRVPFLVQHVSGPFTEWSLTGRWNWGIVLVAFMVTSWVADYWARSSTSRGMQYLGLIIYVIAEAIIFVPLIFIVEIRTEDIIAHGGGNPNILRDSAITTLALFAALTGSVVFTKKDFSMLRGALALGSAAAMMLVVLSLIFGFNLGIIFSIAMVLLASGYILYQTSQVFAHYETEQYVAAALGLFSSVALMFWYVIRIFMRMRQ